MNTIDKAISIKGELRSSDDLTIDGHVEGYIFCEDCAVVFGPTADVSAETIARDVTVHGRVSGQIVATEVVDVREGSRVSAQVIAGRFILEPSADFSGRVEPQHLEAALRVAKFRQRHRNAKAG